MNEQDFLKFGEFWQDVNSAMAASKTLTEPAMRFIFKVLEPYPFELIEQATLQHARNEKFAPQASDIINLLELGNKRPLSDEAWSLIPKDEQTSAWLTGEMLAAWSGVCDMYSYDKIGARMGFRVTYDRLCSEAELQRKPVKWDFSAGYDNNQRRDKVMEGLQKGYISKERATALLPSRIESTDFGRMLIGDGGAAKTEQQQRNAEKFRQILADLGRLESVEQQKRESERAAKEKVWLAAMERAEILQRQHDAAARENLQQLEEAV